MSVPLSIDILNLLDSLLDHLKSSWDAHKKFYLETLIPTQIKDPSKAMEGEEKRIFQELKRLLTQEQQSKLSELLAFRRTDRIREAEEVKRQAKEKKTLEAQKIINAAREKELKAKEDQRKRQAREEFRPKLIKQFNEDFLGADAFIKTAASDIYSEQDYLQEKTDFVQDWIQRELKVNLDPQQASAVAAVNGHIKVIARAGSGKTTTLTSRALFLQNHCGISPSEILLLAFNKKAATEMWERISGLNKGAVPHVMTFHALAYAILQPDYKIIADYNNGDAHSYSRVVQDIINDHLQSPEGYEKIRDLMLSHFRFYEDWEKAISGGFAPPNQADNDSYRFSRESLRGESLKSLGEKVIADFLFEHDLSYIYEKAYYWNNRSYRPDFTIYGKHKKNIIIEYFGMQGDADYDKMSEDKRNYWKDKGYYNFLEYSPVDIRLGGIEAFRECLKADLEKHLGPITKLSEDEIWNRIEKRAKYKFTNVAGSFIGKCRKLMVSPEDLAKMISSHISSTDAENKFLKIVGKLYASYLERLKAAGEQDFDGLMAQAAISVSTGSTLFHRKEANGDLKKIRYILIDEFQDFSKLFWNLTKAIRTQNPAIQFFCVGDDWQAINGFAGSDLEFFANFEKYFSHSKSISISTNYRSAKDIVESGNELMNGLGDPAIAKKEFPGRVLLGHISRFTPIVFENERHRGDIYTPALLRLIKYALDADKDIALLFRTNTCPWFVYSSTKKWTRPLDISEYAEFLRSFFPKNKWDNISASTVHKYKGLEKSFVILPDCTASHYPLIHPDWLFNRVLGDTLEAIEMEEKRLFYVAMTRSKDELIMISESDYESIFLEDLKHKSEIQEINWGEFKPLPNAQKRWSVFILPQDGATSNATYSIKDQLQAAGYKFQSTENQKGWIKQVSPSLFSFDSLEEEVWVPMANKVEVQVFEDSDNLKIKCCVENGQLRLVSGKFEVQQETQ